MALYLYGMSHGFWYGNAWLDPGGVMTPATLPSEVINQDLTFEGEVIPILQRELDQVDPDESALPRRAIDFTKA